MDRSLDADRRYWDLHARRDPLWAVLSESSKKDRGWRLDAFMAHGEREISLLFHQLADLGMDVPRRRALDFGCGVGRVSQALHRRFSHVTGIDISPRMIDLARRLNAFPGRVEYLVHDSPDFARITQPFDFIYSNIVLQHIRSDLAADYIRAFCSMLGEQGLLIFQLPSHRAPREGRQPRAMPNEAYRAGLTLAGALPLDLPASSEIALAVRIANDSPIAWDQSIFGSIRAGNHWLDPSGGMLVQDDGRAQVRERLDAGDQQVIELVVTTPAAGPYLLEIDTVHEGITWFGDRGSKTLRVPVIVGSAGEASQDHAAPRADAAYEDDALHEALEPLDAVLPPDAFPMHAIARSAVEGIIRDAAASLVRVEEDDHAKPEWAGYRYFVRRPY